MRVLLIIILIDFLIFTIGAIFAEKEHTVYDSQKRDYHIDRYGYYWVVEE